MYDSLMRRGKLREAREAADKTQEQVAHAIGVDRTTVGKWERGESTPTPGQRGPYAAAINVTLSELHSFLSSLPEEDEGLPTPLKISLAVEQAATSTRSHIGWVVHGLLQTPDYAAAIARAVGTTATPEDYVRRNVEQRAHRQQRVRSGQVDLHVVQTEASLRSQIGDPGVMATQLRHLAEMAAMATVTVQVVPFARGQYEAQRVGTFSLHTMPWSATPTVDLSAYGGVRLIDAADEAAYFQDAFDHACRVAMSPRASIKFIDQLRTDWEAA